MDQPYIVSARKYRPSTFHSVVGQKALTATLKNAIDTNRLAQAYLFCGPRGVGKTSCARIFAKTINCTAKTPEGEACNSCESCRAFNEGRSLNIVELDAASNNSVDDIRKLTEQVHIPPQTGDYKVFIIDEVHMLSTAAFNAFLKTLEEPPAYVVFILATTEKHKVIPTILSRCQIYDFNRITVADMVEHLQYVAGQEGIQADPAALNVIAQKADGAMRDALSIFDQVAASSMGNITYRSAIDNLNVLDYEYYFRLVEAFLAGDVQQSLLIYKEVRDSGFDSLFFVNGLGAHIRDLLVAANPPTASLLEVSPDVARRYVDQASKIPPQWYYAAMEYVNFCDLNYRVSTSKQFLVELTLIRICNILAPGIRPVDPSKSQIQTPLSTPQSQPAPEAPASAAPAAAPASSSTAPQAAPSAAQAPATQAAPKPTQASQAPQAQSQAQAPHAPQSGPVPAPKPKPPVRLRPAGTVRHTVRISEAGDNPEAASESADDPGHADGGKRTSFTADQLLEAWEKFRQQHTDKPILYNTMRSARPVPAHDFVYCVTVQNPAQRDELADNADLLEFLKNEVGNDSLRLEYKLADPDARPQVLTKPELLKEIVEKNPSISELLTEFDCRLER